MSIHIRAQDASDLVDLIKIYTDTVSVERRGELKRAYNEFVLEYNRLSLQGKESREAKAAREAFQALEKVIENRSLSSSVSLKDKCQNLSLDRWDMGLGISVLGAAGLSYTLPGSATCASYALCATGMPFAMPAAVAGLSILAVKKIGNIFFR